MKIYSVYDEEFKAYGRVVDGYDYSELLQVLEETTPMPSDGVVYVPSDKQLEATSAFAPLRDNCYGGMPIQIGYCNGNNTKLNCLEYHRDSEINIPSRDAVLLLALKSEMAEDKLDTSVVKAFRCPAGTAVEVYATTLHYAPCNASAGNGFRVVIVLPLGTNTDKPAYAPLNKEDAWMTARNKWLLAHPDAADLPEGAYIGLTGENIDIAGII